MNRRISNNEFRSAVQLRVFGGIEICVVVVHVIVDVDGFSITKNIWSKR